jgi:hypothetical protein
MTDKLKKVQDDDLSIIELDNRCDMSVIDPTLALVLFDSTGPTLNSSCNTNCVAGC